MISVYPGNIIGEVVNRCYAGHGVHLSVRLKHKTKVDVVFGTVAAASEGLPREPIAKIINQLVIDGPCMASGQSPGMAPNQRRGRTGKPLGKSLVVVDHIRSNKRCLRIRQVEIK